MTVTELVSPRAATRGLALVRALRPHQWVKNLLLFVPVVLDHKLFHAATMARTAPACSMTVSTATRTGTTPSSVRVRSRPAS